MYPWQDLYNAAALETDPKAMQSRIEVAAIAIESRMEELNYTEVGTAEERGEIANAVGALSRLRHEWEQAFGV